MFSFTPSFLSSGADTWSSSNELKDKLNQESDNNRQLALRKEIESKTFQERIDKLVRRSLPLALSHG